MTASDGMDCPHCRKGFFSRWEDRYLLQDEEKEWSVIYQQCPTCGKAIIRLVSYNTVYVDGNRTQNNLELLAAYPISTTRAPVPQEVPKEYSKDYIDACRTLPVSANASAACSRRCLQNLIRHHFGIDDKQNLYDEIEALIETNDIPSYIKKDLHTFREGGAVGAHPMKDPVTTQILDVEPEEAEHLLDVLEALFDFCFVAPDKAEQKRQALSEKYKKKNRK